MRFGVAPDHQKIKAVIRVYEKIAASKHVRFFGNVEVGRNISVEDLRKHYHQILYAVGCAIDRRLGIPGEGFLGTELGAGNQDKLGHRPRKPNWRRLGFIEPTGESGQSGRPPASEETAGAGHKCAHLSTDF